MVSLLIVGNPFLNDICQALTPPSCQEISNNSHYQAISRFSRLFKRLKNDLRTVNNLSLRPYSYYMFIVAFLVILIDNIARFYFSYTLSVTEGITKEVIRSYVFPLFIYLDNRPIDWPHIIVFAFFPLILWLWFLAESKEVHIRTTAALTKADKRGQHKTIQIALSICAFSFYLAVLPSGMGFEFPFFPALTSIVAISVSGFIIGLFRTVRKYGWIIGAGLYFGGHISNMIGYLGGMIKDGELWVTDYLYFSKLNNIIDLGDVGILIGSALFGGVLAGTFIGEFMYKRYPQRRTSFSPVRVTGTPIPITNALADQSLAILAAQ